MTLTGSLRVLAFIAAFLSTGGDRIHAGTSDWTDPAYGSGHHGSWITDEFGLPAYRYTGCTGERTPCIAGDDAIHQLGNDGVNALAHGDGYVELYSARSYHRFANAYDETARAYAGGFGWVKDGANTWSTLWKDRPHGSRYERIFGMGYFKKIIEHKNLRLEHTIYLTEGEDAVLRERLIFTNTSTQLKSITYFNYWDVAWWHPRQITEKPEASGYDPATVRTSYDAARGVIKATSQAEPGDIERPDLWRDPVPQVSFVVHLNGAPHAFETVERAFLGSGGRALPHAVARGSLQNGIDASGMLANQDAVLATEKRFVLAPGARHVLDVAFGLSPRGEEDNVLARLEQEPDFTLPRIVARWAGTIPQVHFPGYPWLRRELSWSYYYLRSSVLREEYFDARVLNQGSIYLYKWGTNSGPRSTFRHLLPLIYTDPELARESLVYFLRAMKPSGELPYSTAGYGAWNKQGFTPSDHTFWLLLAVTEYVHATRDYAFLDERIPYWCEEGRGRCGSATVYEALVAAYGYAKNVVSTGANGLVRLLNADWDDFVVLLSPDRAATIRHGESTMNTALALASYPAFANLAEMRADTATANSVRRDVDALRRAMKAQWRDDHFNRGYVYCAPDSPMELGAASVWIASNGIALGVPGLIPPRNVQALAARIERDNLDPSPVGLAAIGSSEFEGGTPGNWYSLTGPTIEGLLQHGRRALAFRLFLRQTLANHAATHPEYGYGIWTGPDMYFTPLDEQADLGKAGSTWCFPEMCMADLPATNLFAHSEPLLSSLRLAGVRADARGMLIDPGVSGPFSWVSPGYGLIHGSKAVIGWTRAIATDQVVYRVRIPAGIQTEPRVLVNGLPVVASVEWDRYVVFSLPLKRGTYAHWVIY
ncbi:GH36-type glycosyl hydrolase domain-containing protein [Oligoflexus tunisiensis]|uniref:GH36-type glycosyl hydrolase domain-containing protein n=1 Tax=Oligoflexus tunisiensis TaxID=708132 RepID=UPI00159F1098|nr:hypothetical protein [Oligoflexus tunisiensis]